MGSIIPTKKAAIWSGVAFGAITLIILSIPPSPGAGLLVAGLIGAAMVPWILKAVEWLISDHQS